VNKPELAQRLGVTSKRLTTIANALFEGEEKQEFDDQEATQIKGVVEFMRQKNEASVRKAVNAYKEGTAAAIKYNPRSGDDRPVAIVGDREAGIAALSQQHYDMARKRAIKQAVAIQETSQTLLADFLEHGIPLDEISEVDLDVLECSSERVYDAALGKYDSASNYLPALARPKMLSAAIN
jgi:hypothetical protein